jgi:2-isopropylmalate synthase
MQAEDVGVPWQPLALGKHSGRHAVQKRLSDLGLSVDAERIVAVYRALMDIADERKIISDDDLVTVVKAVNEAAIAQA